MWRILIVEDEVHVRRSLRSNINWNASGFEVIGEASNGLRALEFIEEHQPDLVLCDIVMPIMNGIDLLKKTREAGLPCLFVMLTPSPTFPDNIADIRKIIEAMFLPPFALAAHPLSIIYPARPRHSWTASTHNQKPRYAVPVVHTQIHSCNSRSHHYVLLEPARA